LPIDAKATGTSPLNSWLIMINHHKDFIAQ